MAEKTKYCQITGCNKKAVKWIENDIKNENGVLKQRGYCFGHYERIKQINNSIK